MMIITGNQYAETPLPEFVDVLRDGCYNSIEKLCDDAFRQANKLSHLEAQQSTANYTTTCHKIISETRDILKERVEKFIPYINTLSEKVSTNHNCSACTGNCKLNHDMQLFELRGSHHAIRSTLSKLQMVSLPLYTDTIYPDDYRVLRNQMALIENYISELIFLEENYLIPKITIAQKSINAGS